ncbi:helix-turn-helix domain-containing protein [Neobacillus sp. PS3-34]|uniref:helix-turn-helix domain-containing protein n=1 Tax=Neobacillus sp. PS3-34 TaxID=3070678 RepID=UPI0027DF4FF0|nr:helix-turn-helix domain-containing protein [Neobacillus sp. PS3-34]WML47668.1 helix-turn-helix domain-containing protein [Neobacillus sp. PS3-34]
MAFIEKLILYCIHQLNGERTIYSIYHLLKGKKSSQTIQDAHLFSLAKYFGVFGHLSRTFLEEFVEAALQRNWIKSCSGDKQHYILTDQGKTVLENQLQINPLPLYVDGWRKIQKTQLVWERLSLLVQVVSNLVFKENRYIPIQKNKDAHRWLKGFLQQFSKKREELGKILFEELTFCLGLTGDLAPAVLIYRLTGNKCIGLTSQQAAEELKMEISEYEIQFLNCLHYLIEKIEGNHDQYLLLSNLLFQTEQEYTLTQSAQRTFEMIQKGYSLERIAGWRKLKKSTIEDHVVEIALNAVNFSIDPYVEKDLQEEILQCAKDISSRQLKTIREKVEKANYFEIRLVLAKLGDRK